jgi:hypothetical protein
MKTFKEIREQVINQSDDNIINEAIQYHLDRKIPFAENIFRVHSDSFYKFFRTLKEQYKNNLLSDLNEFDEELLNTDIGEFGVYENQKVPLDMPIQEEDENPPIGKPKRGGPKKYYVFVRKPDGGIKKVTWGDTTGLSNKMNNPEARKSFAARHRCDQQKDRTSAAYWACNTPRYAKSLGLSGGGSFYW